MSGWVRFENTMPEDERLPGLSDRAFRLWVNAVCYSSRGETDGLVPAVLMSSLSVTATKKTVDELVDAGMLIARGRKFEIHNYLKFNPSKAQLGQMREKNKERASKWRGKHRNAADNDVDNGASNAVSHSESLTGATTTDSVGSTSEDDGEQTQLTRERVDEACSILAAVDRWHIDEVGVENAAATEPDGDLIRACHLAVSWGSDPTWTMGCAATVRAALRKLTAEKPKTDEKQARRRRSADALRGLREATA